MKHKNPKAPPTKLSRYRRVSVTLLEEHYRLIKEHKLALSGLIRDLIDDRFSSTKVVIHLSENGKQLYDHLVSNFGLHDADLEPYFLRALDTFLEGKIERLHELRIKLQKEL